MGTFMILSHNCQHMELFEKKIVSFYALYFQGKQIYEILMNSLKCSKVLETQNFHEMYIDPATKVLSSFCSKSRYIWCSYIPFWTISSCLLSFGKSKHTLVRAILRYFVMPVVGRVVRTIRDISKSSLATFCVASDRYSVAFHSWHW